MADNCTAYPEITTTMSGHPWETKPVAADILEWSIDSENGLVQGPLDFEFLTDKTMNLVLAEGQTALMLNSGELQAVYLEGNHCLHIGRNKNEVSPENQMIFLAADRPITLSWKQQSSIWASSIGSSPEETRIIGNCVCDIIGPGHFYRAFLANIETHDDAFLFRVIDSLIRSQIEQRLADLFQGRPCNAVELQSHLTRLTAEDLSEDLDQFGLLCVQLAVYTSNPPVESLDGETTGQLSNQGEYW